MSRRVQIGICKGCGAQIIWIKTRAGKSMPCNSLIRSYKIVPGGKEKIVTPQGDVVSGITGVAADEADGDGYISHFATCRKALSFRRGAK